MQIIDSADRARGYRLSPILALAAAPAHTGSSPARSLAAAPDVPGPARSLLEAQPQPLISQASPPLPVAAGEAGSDALACAPPPLAGDDEEAALSAIVIEAELRLRAQRPHTAETELAGARAAVGGGVGAATHEPDASSAVRPRRLAAGELLSVTSGPSAVLGAVAVSCGAASSEDQEPNAACFAPSVAPAAAVGLVAASLRDGANTDSLAPASPRREKASAREQAGTALPSPGKASVLEQARGIAPGASERLVHAGRSAGPPCGGGPAGATAPVGRVLRLVLDSTWGDRHYIGLTGLQLLLFPQQQQLSVVGADSRGGGGSGSNCAVRVADGEAAALEVAALSADHVSARPRDLASLGYGGDPRLLRNLVDGCNRTTDDAHMWIVPFDEEAAVAAASAAAIAGGCGELQPASGEHFIEVRERQAALVVRLFDLTDGGMVLHSGRPGCRWWRFCFCVNVQLDLGAPRALAGFTVWNYNKREEDTRRGVRVMRLFLDGAPLASPPTTTAVLAGQGAGREPLGWSNAVIVRKAPGTTVFEFGQFITLHNRTRIAPARLVPRSGHQPPKSGAFLARSRYLSPAVHQDFETVAPPEGLVFKVFFSLLEIF
jgi:hypothetical protein